MRRLKEIALELLDKYEDSESGCISEGISIMGDMKELEDECKWYREEIEAAVGELNCCEKCKMWKENYDDSNRGYCYLDYAFPRATNASDYCSWWEKKRSDHERFN